MEFINPNEIGAKISTLILESGSFFYAITPYIDISNWKKILHNLEIIKKKGVVVKFYVREIKDRDRDALKKLDIELHIIDKLHTKLYLNECQAIFTSMNLYEYSDINSMDLAIKFTEREHYDQFSEYYHKYIEPSYEQETKKFDLSEERYDTLFHFLKEKFPNDYIYKSGCFIRSTDVLPLFNIYIIKDKIRFEHPYRINDNDFKKIKELVKDFKELCFFESTNWKENHYWWSPLEKLSDNDVYDLIIKLQRLKFSTNDIHIPKRRMKNFNIS
ncbi:hypothetical protein [Capnocytophaga canis]|uniref:hypothetical protein n=1 Tax=Capnocytophaga canis TaxID=1848903 RepID=UPI001561B748|nr:hypothetical protein [Capnocytophaga canis]